MTAIENSDMGENAIEPVKAECNHLSFLCLPYDAVERLISGEEVKITYHSRMMLESNVRMAVQMKFPDASPRYESEMMVDCYVRVLNVELEQRGKGRKRPQYNYTYTFVAVD